MLADTLAAGVPTWEPQRHLYGLVKDFIDRSGKGLRPALCIATARALGGRAEDAFPLAAGLEVLHNAFLVHDDIEDGSDSRRVLLTHALGQANSTDLRGLATFWRGPASDVCRAKC
ncbi:polyprenyl synthetase family protein [Bradyrhizobium sp. CCGUVB23]|uniref:polyprenyl synthetase family protein n=1 Tax=Bradyrhizobium sp. CCGUVB23 TaxID=2949630 RepID=UPI0020B26532|nr:polyprenyl synthetase family protein [Bradyrhizobium sp. CCGUVB23]MCP3460014.1 polyprenyl synthetase family protein [Bradyrhizobium sp. CCGUVB23]